MSRWWHANEIAKEYNRTRRTIYRWLEEGYIKGKKIKSNWLVPDEEVKKIIRDPDDDGSDPSFNKPSPDSTT